MPDVPPPPEIVLVAHGNLDRVRELLEEDPGQLNVLYEPWQETPLGAASHVGNRSIAEFLLEQGAPMTICTAAMLGRKDIVGDLLTDDPALANAAGAHGISLLFHAAMSGDVELVEMIVAKGGSTESAGHALQGAVQFGHYEMAKWLLQKGADPNVADFQGKTPWEIAETRGDTRLSALLESHGGRAG